MLLMIMMYVTQMTGYYRGQDGQEYVEAAAEHEVETEKIYKL